MRIERIRINNLSGLEDVDLIFPAGPVLFFSEDKNCYRLISSLILEILYGQKTQLSLMDQNSKGSVEIWLAGKSTGFHVNRQFHLKTNEPEQNSNLVIKDTTGQAVFLPEKIVPGEYLFLTGLNAFYQGVIVEWPERKEKNSFLLKVQNIRQGGDERFSLSNVRASLAGAKKKLEEQKKGMIPLKAEYDALRSEWEEAYRRQEEDRQLLIKIKNLQENRKITNEKITTMQKTQECLALLSQNPDYRELRRLQGEMNRLEERCRELAANLTELTHESKIDWTIIEGLREECLEWALLQEKVEGLASKVRQREQEICNVQDFLQTSEYKALPENEDQRLRRAEDEMLMAQEKLAELTITKSEIEKIQEKYAEGIKHLQDFEFLTGVTIADKIRVRLEEKYLTFWKSSKIGGFFSYHLSKFYQNCHALNYKEFSLKVKEFREQQKIIERLKTEMELLWEKVRQEDELHDIINSRNRILKQAFEAVKAADFPAWLNGWEDYRQKKYLLAVWLDELKLDLEQQQIEENKIAVCAEQLREKLSNWDTTATNRDEVLAAVMRVASQLRAKEEAEREAVLFSQRFYGMLGDRDMEYLAANLEPLADLERETHLSAEERLVNLAAWHEEQLENCRLQEEAEQRLRLNREFPELSVLEKKIETVKKRLTAHEDLQRAVDDTQAMLETSWQEWQTRYGKQLEEETERIYRKVFSLSQQEKTEIHPSYAERKYFACRMALAKLALGDNTEVPLLFSVGEMNEEQGFWEEVIRCFSKLPFPRQVICETSDDKLSQIAAGAGWQIIVA